MDSWVGWASQFPALKKNKRALLVEYFHMNSHENEAGSFRNGFPIVEGSSGRGWAS